MTLGSMGEAVTLEVGINGLNRALSAITGSRHGRSLEDDIVVVAVPSQEPRDDNALLIRGGSSGRTVEMSTPNGPPGIVASEWPVGAVAPIRRTSSGSTGCSSSSSMTAMPWAPRAWDTTRVMQHEQAIGTFLSAPPGFVVDLAGEDLLADPAVLEQARLGHAPSHLWSTKIRGPRTRACGKAASPSRPGTRRSRIDGSNQADGRDGLPGGVFVAASTL